MNERASSTTITGAGRIEDAVAPATRYAGSATATLSEAALTIGGGFAVAVVVLQWLVPFCFSC